MTNREGLSNEFSLSGRGAELSPRLWRESFIPPVYTRVWKNLIPHTLRNWNTHCSASHTLPAVCECAYLSTHSPQTDAEVTNTTTEMWHISDVLMCETDVSQVCFSHRWIFPLMSPELPANNNTLRKNRRCFFCSVLEEEGAQSTVTCFYLPCVEKLHSFCPFRVQLNSAQTRPTINVRTLFLDPTLSWARRSWHPCPPLW